MKKGIAMISKLSIPVNSFSATASIGTGHRVQEAQYREPERDRDRHAGQHQRDQQAEDEAPWSSGHLFATAGFSITPST